MSGVFRRLLFVLLFAAVLAACSGSQGIEDVDLDVPAEAVAYVPHLEGPLRILSATPAGTMQGMGPALVVAVTFSQPMVPLGEAVDVPEGTLRLAPEVPGTLQWEGTQTLVFVPSSPLPPATAFHATLAGGLRALGGDVMEDGYVWSFETPRPMLLRADPADGAAYADPAAPVRLWFNQQVDGASAERYVRLRPQDGRPVRLSAGGGADSTLTLAPAAPLAPGTAYELTLLPGLPSAEGDLGLADTTVLRFSTYGPPALQRAYQPRAWWEEEREGVDPERGVTLEFATPVRFADLRRALSFSPAVELPTGIEAKDDVVSAAHTLPGPWAPETNYTVTVRNLTDTFGQVLQEGTATFRTRAFDPSVRMPDGVMVVEAAQQAFVPIRVTNVPSVQLGLRRLRADEIVPLLPVYDPMHYYPGSEESEADRPAPMAASRRLTLDVPRNRPTVAPVRLDSLTTGGTGVVAFRMVGPALPRHGASDVRGVAQVTNLGLTAKFSAHQNLILVTDLQTAAPVAGAQVTLRDASNTVRWRGATDETGQARSPGWAALGLTPPNEWSAPVQYVFVERGGDLAFTTSLYTDGVEPYRFDLNYNWWPEPVTETGSVFTDRGLYRAGETVHVKGILRSKTDGDWRPVTDSIRVLVGSPRDRIVYDRRLLPGDLGTFDFTWEAPASADQGVYEVRVVHASDTAATTREPWQRGDVARGTFRVDAFRTATFEVNARTAAPHYVAGDFFEGAVSGRYLFGATMAGQPVRYRLRQTLGDYTPPGYDGWRFGVPAYRYDDYRYRVEQVLVEADTVLGADGSVSVRRPLPGNERGAPTTLVWSGSVTDPARQELSAQTSITLHPGLFYIGLKPRTTFLDLSRENTLSVDVVTVDPGGQPVSGKPVDVTLARRHWNSVREVGSDGRLRWRSEMTEEPVRTLQVRTEPGKAKRLQLQVQEGGSYVVRAAGRDLRGNLVQSEAYFYATGGGYVAWERTDDDRIELVAERTRYRPGETARILVPSPYEEATALVTVEREGILSSRVETLTGSTPQIEIPLTEDHLPNVFVSVILLTGRTAEPGLASDAGAPAFKAGYVELAVDPGSRHLQVEVVPARETYRPGDEVTVDLRLRDAGGRGVPGEIAFSAADVGVLSLIGYQLPDPFDTFYGSRPLGVTTAESRANLVEQRSFGQKEEDLIGGGGDAEFLLRKDFRPLAHWAPAVRTDAQGRARVTFRLPENLTTFRLMATALTAQNAFGAGRADILVTQPLVLQPALPRFARLDDAFEAGVLVANRTGEAGEVAVTAEGQGLALEGAARKTVRLEAGETREVRFRWSVPETGEATLTFTAQLGGERDAFTLTLPVAAPTTKRATATFASTEDAASEAVRLPDDYLPGLGGLDVRLASTALVGLDGAVEYLFEYPYGCLEQRTSRIRPLLAGDALLEAFDLQALGGGDRRAVVNAWLAGLDDYWVGDGFVMWPGSRWVSLYTTAYVVAALAEAEAAGFDVPADLREQAVAVVEDAVRNRSRRPDYYSPAVWADTRAFMLYALARHGRVLESEISALAEAHVSGRDRLSVDGESFLLRTVAAANRPALARFREPLVEGLRTRVRVEAATAYFTAPGTDDYGWIFASDVRATAFGLAALLEAAPTPETQQLAQRMVRYLMAARQGGAWASTQDNVAVLDAFRRYYDVYEQATPDFTAEVRVAGRQLLQEAFQGRSLKVAEAERPPEALAVAGQAAGPAAIEIAKRGAGRLYYSLRLETYTRAPQPAATHGLSVERRIQRLDDRGQPVGQAQRTGGEAVTLRPGELVRVTLRLTSPADRHYVVVDDALPAGLEALNAAFETANQEVLRNADAGQDRWWGSFNHTEMRDDRVLLFADYLARGEHTYSYVARATTPGTFVHPPAQAELMYEPEVNGRTATGTLVVQSPDEATARR